MPLEDGGLECHADIDSLDPGNEYLLRVIANNSLGSSHASEVGERLRPHLRTVQKDTSMEPGPAMMGAWDGGCFMFTLANFFSPLDPKWLQRFDGGPSDSDANSLWMNKKRAHCIGTPPMPLPPSAGKVCTKAAAPLPPDPPHMAAQAATANALQLAWSEPWGNGAPITNYTLEMAPADALLSQCRDPSQVGTSSCSSTAEAQTPSHFLAVHFHLVCLLTHPCVTHQVLPMLTMSKCS